jgi:hypothetical protein
MVVGMSLVGCGSKSDPMCAVDQRLLDGGCYADPPPCGNPPWEGCNRELGADDCARNGGVWQCEFWRPTYCFCNCPTGDGDCPCWKVEHCQGQCLGDDLQTCEEIEVGRCSGWLMGSGDCVCTLYPEYFDSFVVGCP